MGNAAMTTRAKSLRSRSSRRSTRGSSVAVSITRPPTTGPQPLADRVPGNRLNSSGRIPGRMTGNTEVIDGRKTKEFRSELARAGFPG